MNETQFLFSDISLARRLERAEGKSNAAYVEARARVFPECGAEWVETAGAYAMFDGVDSPLTQSFGLGLFQPVGDSDLDELERFFQSRGAPVFHEVSPLAEASLPSLLSARGYRPIEFTSVLHRPIGSELQLDALRNDSIRVRRIQEGEEDLWGRTAAEGWSEIPEIAPFMMEIGRVGVRNPASNLFLAELDGRPIAAGVLNLGEGVALLAGASTVPRGRRQGAQLALLEERLRFGAGQGCDIAMMGAAPGSGSQRNAERHGFRIAYTRIKWQLVGGA